MRAPIILPDLGGSAVRLSVWFADVGDLVFEGDRLVEVLVNGATFDVAAPATGRVVEKHVLPRDLLQIGQTLGLVEVDPKQEV
jgi:pyruvate/2-oxoglutarate dehydrogenase complex dihydrolipoamide acyltransferase (E2) component